MGNCGPFALSVRQRWRSRQECSASGFFMWEKAPAVAMIMRQAVQRRATTMMREFKFEDEMHTTLACVPMAVRRKLDRVGVKIGLEQWKALGRGERLAICHLPVERHEEREALTLFINEAVRRVCGEEPRALSEAQRAVADPPVR